MNAISLSTLGGQFFHPKPGYVSPDLSTASIYSEEDWDNLKCSFYINSYLGFQIYDARNSDYVDFLIERDHELVIQEAYCLISTLLPLSA
jgi:hypothetical protein